MPQRIHVGADMIPEHDEVTGGEPVDAIFSRADALRELLPRLVHGHRRTHYAGKHLHVVMHGHAQIDQLATHPTPSGYCVAVIPPSRYRVCPVMKSDAGETKNKTAPSTSSVSAIRPMGMRATRLR